MELIRSIAVFAIVLPFLAFNINAEVFDITSYGAKPDADVSEALSAAWKAGCAAPTPSKVVVPAGTWTLSQVKLLGPSKAPLELEIKGTLQAFADPSKLPNKEWEWVTINYIDFLTISGGGVLDGQGHVAWTLNDCGLNSKCAKMPINLSLNFIRHSIIHDVTVQNSKNFQVNCISSLNVTFQNFHVSAPGTSINTDGIHIARSTQVSVLDSVIETGDDCISIGDDTHDLRITNVACGPGHGISIGSLGKNPAEKDVSDIYITGCTFKGTQNGVRIKTWPSSPGTLKVSGIFMEDLTMDKVDNPIIIDQEYCPWNQCNKDKPSLIEISNVKINKVKGTSNTAQAITFACSSAKPCQNVEVGDVDLTFVGTTGGPITTFCKNINPTLKGKQNPPLCPPQAAA